MPVIQLQIFAQNPCSSSGARAFATNAQLAVSSAMYVPEGHALKVPSARLWHYRKISMKQDILESPYCTKLDLLAQPALYSRELCKIRFLKKSTSLKPNIFQFHEKKSVLKWIIQSSLYITISISVDTTMVYHTITITISPIITNFS